MATAWVLLLVLLAWPAAAAAAVARDSLLNICMDAKHHKTEPGPEGQLYGQVGARPGTHRHHPPWGHRAGPGGSCAVAGSLSPGTGALPGMGGPACPPTPCRGAAVGPG